MHRRSKPLLLVISLLVGFVALTIPTRLEANTILGLHGAIGAPEIVAPLGARMVRGIIFDSQLDFENQTFLDKLQDFKNRGIETVIALRWPTDPEDSMKMDRIPENQAAALDQVEDFLFATNGLVDWFQIQNEPLGGPGRYGPGQERDALEWLREVGARARSVIDSHGLATRIVTPGITGIEGAMRGGEANIRGIDSILRIGRDYADAVDVHLHVRDVADLEGRVGYIETRMGELGVNTALTTLEWSQAGVMDAWFDEHPEDLAYVQNSYGNQRTPQEWADFMQTLPLEPNFMEDAYDALNERGFLHAAYGGLWQYGNPKFDVKAILSNQTVKHKTWDRLLWGNEPIYSQYVTLASRVPEPQSWLLGAMASVGMLLRRRHG